MHFLQSINTIKHECAKAVKISKNVRLKRCKGKSFCNIISRFNLELFYNEVIIHKYTIYRFFISLGLLHFRTIAIALKDVASQILSNAAGLGKEITASIVVTENVFRHEPNEVGVDLKHQLCVNYQD